MYFLNSNESDYLKNIYETLLQGELSVLKNKIASYQPKDPSLELAESAFKKSLELARKYPTLILLFDVDNPFRYQEKAYTITHFNMISFETDYQLSLISDLMDGGSEGNGKVN